MALVVAVGGGVVLECCSQLHMLGVATSSSGSADKKARARCKQKIYRVYEQIAARLRMRLREKRLGEQFSKTGNAPWACAEDVGCWVWLKCATPTMAKAVNGGT